MDPPFLASLSAEHDFQMGPETAEKRGVLVVGVIDRVLVPAGTACKVLVLRCADQSLPFAHEIGQHQLKVLASVPHVAEDDPERTIVDVQNWCHSYTMDGSETVGAQFIHVYVWESTSVAKTNAAVERGAPRFRALEDEAPVITNIGGPLDDASLVLCRVRLTRRDFSSSESSSSRPRYRRAYVMGASHVMRIYRTSFSPS
ncbi:hypothetical protein C8R43DRAFT_1133594 [Mycena crocata]|nr:hypothetical protein C8R43DRAFT_1133594 [Mycena crocata]